MKKFAVIVAGGSGTRMGAKVPKQFLKVKDKPLLFYPLRAFLDAFKDLQIILVLPLEHISIGEEIIDAYFDKSRIRITAGGDTRFQSVKNGLQLIDDESIIFVHDGVRSLISTQLIKRCYEAALEKGSAIPAIKSKDSVRIVTDEGNEAIDRDKVMLIQTPQTFHSKILLSAYNIDFKDRFTDEASVVEAFGLKVFLVEGEDQNIKITHPADMQTAESLLGKQSK